jgi:hypothetical protein
MVLSSFGNKAIDQHPIRIGPALDCPNSNHYSQLGLASHSQKLATNYCYGMRVLQDSLPPQSYLWIGSPIVIEHFEWADVATGVV